VGSQLLQTLYFIDESVGSGCKWEGDMRYECIPVDDLLVLWDLMLRLNSGFRHCIKIQYDIMKQYRKDWYMI